jgi:hypothetical protein
LDLLGFIRPIRGFSKRYDEKNKKFFSSALLASDMRQTLGGSRSRGS